MAEFREYTPNSHKYREEQKATSSEEKKKIEKVVNGTVKIKKKSEISKFADIFVAKDVGTVKRFIVDDVIIPTIRDTVWSIFTNSLDMFLYGGTGRADRRPSGSKVSYRKFYDQRDDRRSNDPPRTRTRFDFDDIVFTNRGDAERVREEMDNIIDEYGVVTVADMYDMADRSQPYTSNRYGWTSIRSAEVVRLRGGDYILKLPRPMPID